MAAKGARVTHVDASKKAVGAAVENQKLSGLGEAPIRWIIDDALKFVEREVRRGRRYAGIILDPPKYGRGPKGEVWELDEKLAALMAACAALLDDRSKFLVLTAYAVRLSAIAIANLTEEVTRPLGGNVEAGEMTIREEARGLLLPTAIFARWSRQ
jgi:23S rRNA (cytosine1962-C5)-methyltransferase